MAAVSDLLTGIQPRIPPALFRRAPAGARERGGAIGAPEPGGPAGATRSTASLLAAGLFAAALAQILAAAVFFYAANWWTMAPALKLGALMAALAGCGVGWAVTPPGVVRSSLACAGAVLGGLLFAVHGQIWQTGANTWELFAVWTLVAAVWAVLTLEDAALAVCAVVGVTAIGLHLVEVRPSWIFFRTEDLTVVKALLLSGGFMALLVTWRLLLSAVRPDRWFGPVFAALSGALFLVAGCHALIELDLVRLALGIPARILLVSVVLLALLRWGGLKPWLQGYLFVVALVMGTGLVIRAGWEGAEHFGLLDVFDVESWIAWIGISAVTLGFLALMMAGARRLFFRAGPGAGAGKLVRGALWVGAALGSWLGVTALAFGVAGLWYELLAAFIGTRLLSWAPLASGVSFALAALAVRGSGALSTQVRACLFFWSLVALSLFVGLFSFDYLANSWESLDFCVRNGAVAGVVLTSLYFAVKRASGADVPAGLFGVVAGILALLGQMVMMGLGASLQAWVFLGLAPVVLALGLVAVWRPSAGARAVGVALLVSAFLIPAVIEFLGPYGLELPVLAPRGLAVLMGGVLLAAAVLASEGRWSPGSLAAALVLLGGTLLVPAGGAALVGLGALALVVVGWPLLVAGFALGAWSVGWFYYSLALPLDGKALSLAAGGLVFLAVWGALAQKRLRGPVWRPAALVSGLVCALVPVGLEVADGRAKEQIVAHGHEVYLPLRPVDPRSLVQGDYMALAYGIDGLRGKLAPRDRGCLFLDGGSVARSLRAVPQEGGCEAGGREIPIGVRPGKGGVRIAPDSFFFQEGTAKTWEQARYAVVRVLDGQVVMTGLADADRQTLRPPAVEPPAVEPPAAVDPVADPSAAMPPVAGPPD
ncbi:GDYXXLXY domain-containing protein [Phaeovibrio sulfidiphilus]|uniref:GDYXXLXY domain-containing protein n=1 Tax=Phaeovibrio sulfidiphilus TaxID=1220600 RepID=A0A8J7CCT3_9PROT|nr:GDYXXLXY domain-containing protein [Phaeovibrio sulfidiphilus]MBE1236094.1 GDYXXLXY domain-containing protein [Phaeovibrio sulfidiphilus]